MKIIVAFIAGCLFGLGLVVSGLSNPSKVLNFLDVFGTFDPSLLFVMAGAIAVSALGYRFVWGRERPLFEEQFYLPSVKGVDARLLIGSTLFGVGWGLVGFCPGPALTSLTFGGMSALIFVMAMVVGIVMAKVFAK